MSRVLSKPSVTDNGSRISIPESVLKKPPVERVNILPLNMKTIKIKIVGTAPYLQCRFDRKIIDGIRLKQTTEVKPGAKSSKNRPPKDYEAMYQGSIHRFSKDDYGIPCAAFRAGAIDACRVAGYAMTMAKMSIFCEADGMGTDNTPLVRINAKPQMDQRMGRNASGGCDVRVRAIYLKWSATLTIRFDADQFTTSDVVNLFARVGAQVGVGEGRPFSKDSAGMGFGTFEVVM